MTGLLTRPDEPPPASGSRRRWLYRSLAVVVVAALVWLIAFSSVLGVSSIQVRGTSILTADEVRAAAGVNSGTPLLRVDLGVVRARIAALGPVASVTVHRSYPNTLTISITERRAVGYRVNAQGVQYVDAGGVAFLQSTHQPSGVPRLALATDPAVATAEAVVAGELGDAVRARTETVSAVSVQSVTLNLAGARTVLWGGTDRAAQKVVVLRGLLGHPGGAAYFDVSDPDVVVTRPTPPTG